MKTKRFEVTEQHVALLRRMYVSWEDAEFGAPCIDPKRPYGNGDVLGDIRGILGVQGEACPHCGESLEGEGDSDKLKDLHDETQTALQIFLATGAMEPGWYEAGEYEVNWRRVSSTSPPDREEIR